MNRKAREVLLGKRINYFSGRLLTAEDLNEEQTYHLNKRRLHNLALHGWGVVTGLDVSISSEKGGSILVGAGVAIDAQGNEIILSSDLDCAPPGKWETAYLVLSWAERGTDPVPVAGDQTMPSRVEEYAILKCEPDADGRQPSGVVLARLNKSRGKWQVDKRFRLRRAKRLPR